MYSLKFRSMALSIAFSLVPARRSRAVVWNVSPYLLMSSLLARKRVRSADRGPEYPEHHLGKSGGDEERGLD